MTQSRSADPLRVGAWAAQGTAGPAPAPWNRRVVYLLIVLVAIPAVLALTLTGLRVTDATRSAGAYGQAGRLGTLGQQVVGLTQAMADERSGTASFISDGRPAASLAALRQQYAATDAWAARVRRLVPQLGSGYPAQTRADAALALSSIGRLPGLRRQAVQSQASAQAVITGYSAATAGLFPVIDGIADLSGNPSLITNVRALSSLSRMNDQASQQQAILGAALAGGRFGPGALTALITAQAQQASDLASFRASALPEESWALTQTLAGSPARQAQAVEQEAIAAGNGALAFGPQASQQWSAGMSYEVGWMDHAEQELAAWIPAYAQAQQQSAMRSAIVTGGVGLGVLALFLLGAVFAARSVLRWRRRPESATPEGAAAPLLNGAGAPLPSSAGEPLPGSADAISDGFFLRSHSLLDRLLRLIDNWELNEDDPERLANLFEMDQLATQIRRNSDAALVLTGHEPPRSAEPLALLDVLRGATSEIEQYRRVTLDVQQGVRVSGTAAADTVHLLAELLENATTFSPETTPVIVSGHAVCGGGSLITITDGGTGMSEEELTLLNRQLVDPSLADMTAAPRTGLPAVALLAARHGITVTLSMPPDGGTTAEVYLPAALVGEDAGPGGRQGRAGEAPLAETSTEAAAWAAKDLPLSARRSVPGPEPFLGPEADAPEPVPLMLGAPVPSPAPETSTGATEPETMSAEPGDGPPIFESVRSGYGYAFGRDLPPVSEQQADKPPAEPPARPAAFGGNGRAVVWPPTARPQATSGLPKRVPEPGRVRGRAAAQEAGEVPVAEPADQAKQAGKPPARPQPDADSGPAEPQRQAAWTGWLKGSTQPGSGSGSARS